MLHDIQKELKAPKNQRNTFGNYNYRSCEDIMEAVKPLLGNAILTISDEVVEVGGRIYVKATATYKSADEEVTTTAYAREPETKKGMDEAQITGATSSYARKYALNGLFAIDDTKDSDATNTHDKKEEKRETKPKFTQTEYQGFVEKITNFGNADDAITKIKTKYELDSHFEEKIRLAFNF